MLVPGISQPDEGRWATVTQASPLRIKVDGESTALPFTPITLVQGLAVNDRVWVSFPTNKNPAFRGRRVIIIGKANGPKMASGQVTINPTANTPTSGAVTFPSGLFSAAPVVIATAQSSLPESEVREVTVQSVTSTGCNIWLYRTNTTSTGVYWIAIGS